MLYNANKKFISSIAPHQSVNFFIDLKKKPSSINLDTGNPLFVKVPQPRAKRQQSDLFGLRVKLPPV